MNEERLKKIMFGGGLVMLAVTCWLAYTLFLVAKTARMREQCTVLATEIAGRLAGTNGEAPAASLDEALALFKGGSLLPKNRAGRIIDSWGHPLLLKQTVQDGKVTVRVTSAGRDGQPGTADDFSQETTVERKPQ